MTDDANPRVPRTCVPGAPNFQSHIEELLKIAGVRGTSVVRDDLDACLKLAWIENSMERDVQRNPAPPPIIKQLTNSIRKTQALLRRLEGYSLWHNIGYDGC